jgi:hypothetical protein
MVMIFLLAVGSCGPNDSGQTALVAEGYVGAFGPGFLALTPGWSSNVLMWNVSLAPSTGCTGIAGIGVSALSASAATLYAYTPVSYTSCPSGFTVTLTGIRTDGSNFSASCPVSVSITQVGY